jgi:Transglycosylase SLT domain
MAMAGMVASMLGRSGKYPRSSQPVDSLRDSNSSRLTEVLVFMRSFLSALLMIACAALLGEGACAESVEPPAAAGKQADDELAPLPTPDDRARHDEAATAEEPANDGPAAPPATDGDRAKRDEEAVATSSSSEVGNAPRAELTGSIDSVCVILESAAAANGLPLEFFARVIWEESRFQLNVVGPTTSSGDRAQGIAQFMPDTAAQRGLLDPFDPTTALPEAAEFLAELRSEFGNLGLAAAAYNAGPGRVRDFIDRRAVMPAQTRNYVRAITGRSVDEWVVLGRDGGKDGIAKPISCHQLATLLKERPSFVIGKVERKAREAALRPQRISDRRNTSSGQSRTRRVAAPPTRSLALARNRNPSPSQVRAASLPTTGSSIRRPRTSLLAASGKSGKSAGAVSRSTSKASTLSKSGPASGRLPASSPNGIGRKHSATRVAARPTAGAAARNRKPLPVRAASLPTTEGATRRAKTNPSPAESRNSSATPGRKGKSTGGVGRATSVASAPSSSRARVVSSELVAREKVAEDRLRKIMQICRGC